MEENGQVEKRKKRISFKMVLICLGAANLLLSGSGFIAALRWNQRLEEKIQRLEGRISSLETSIPGTIQNISSEVQKSQERANSFLDSFRLRIIPEKNSRAKLIFNADLKEYREKTEVYFVWDDGENTVEIPADHLEGTRFQAEAEVSALTEEGSVKIYRKEGETLEGETMEDVFSVKDACYMGLECYGMFGWSTSIGEKAVQLSPEASVYITSMPEGVSLERVEAQLYIGGKLVHSENMRQEENGEMSAVAEGYSGDGGFASWSMEAEFSEGEQVDLRIVAEDSNGTVYSAIAARGRVRLKGSGLHDIDSEPLDSELHVEPKGERAWILDGSQR